MNYLIIPNIFFLSEIMGNVIAPLDKSPHLSYPKNQGILKVRIYTFGI